MTQPWTCPACGRGVAPGEKTCDHGGLSASPLPGYFTPAPRIIPTTPPVRETPAAGSPPRYRPYENVCLSGRANPNLILMN